MKSAIFSALVVLLVACGGGQAAEPTTPAGAAAPEAKSGKAARPSCDAIDEACDPHEKEGGTAKECHDLGEDPKNSEEACAARKTACLAACPPVAKK